MLNVNNLIKLFLISLFTTSLYAVDVSNFDIKGIKLGMSKKEVLKRMPCKNPKIKTEKLKNNKVFDTEISCGNDTSSEILDVTLDHHNIVYNIRRYKRFKISPNWKKIEKKIINYYSNNTLPKNTP